MPPKNFRNVSHPELEISPYWLNFSKKVSKQTDWQNYKKFRIIWYKCKNFPGMPPKNFRKISHTELEISLYLSDFSEEISRMKNWQTYKKLTTIWNKCSNIPGMPPKNFRKISHTELEISLYLSNFSKRVSQLTDWQTYKKFRIISN